MLSTAARKWGRNRAPSREPVRRLLAALHADIVGYSRLFAHDDSGTVARLLALHHQGFAPTIDLYRGQLVQTGGDSLLVLFDSIVHAVQCAVAIQKALPQANEHWQPAPAVRMRIGVDLGDVIMDGLNFHGDGVIIATRLQEVCPPGAVCVSRTIFEGGGERLGLPTEPLGTLALKHVTRPVEAFLLWPPRTDDQVRSLKEPRHTMGSLGDLEVAGAR